MKANNALHERDKAAMDGGAAEAKVSSASAAVLAAAAAVNVPVSTMGGGVDPAAAATSLAASFEASAAEAMTNYTTSQAQARLFMASQAEMIQTAAMLHQIKQTQLLQRQLLDQQYQRRKDMMRNQHEVQLSDILQQVEEMICNSRETCLDTNLIYFRPTCKRCPRGLRIPWRRARRSTAPSV